MENLVKTPLLDYRAISRNYFEKLYWEKGLTVCGVDEVGRGPLAGPIVAAAVSLGNNANSPLIRDSKTLSEKKLLQAFDWITQNSVWTIGTANHNFIDTYSIVMANHIAMKKAVSLLVYRLKKPLSGIIVDAVKLEIDQSLQGQVHAFCKAESLSISVAAASIVAKVYRDRLMNTYDTLFGGYHFPEHKGYGTKKHYQALDNHGASSIHRKSFLKRYMNDTNK
jgi:ribonuclease HII